MKPMSSRRLLALVAAFVVMLWPAGASAQSALAAKGPVVPSDGRLHRLDVGGRRMAIWCRGTGSPTVILEHGIGYGVDSDSWATVQAGLATETRVCRYDRAGAGDSDRAKPGRSMPDLAHDLLLLLDVARIPGPYILVGHSFGGLTVRYFAQLYPERVIGMVLVDGSPPSAITSGIVSSERLNHARVVSQLKQLALLRRIPLVVITRGLGLSPSWRAAQEAMLGLSPSSRQVIATASNHWIQLRQPALVIRQVLTVLHTIRRRQ